MNKTINKSLVFALIIVMSFSFVHQAQAGAVVEVITSVVDVVADVINVVINAPLAIAEMSIGVLPGLDFIFQDGQCRLSNMGDSAVHVYAGECGDGSGGGSGGGDGSGIKALQVDLKVNNSQGPVTLVIPASFELEWDSLNAQSCKGTDSWSGDYGTSGTSQASNNTIGNFTYGIECSDADGNIARDSILIYTVGPQVTMQAIQDVTVPDPLRVSWSSSYTSSCTASSDPNVWNGSKALSGTEDVFNPTAVSNRGDYSFTISCSDNYGNSAIDSKTAKVLSVPKCNFNANPETIVLPQTSTLSWSCNYATACSIDNAIGSVSASSGSVEVAPAETTTYTLHCDGYDGSKSLQVTVGNGYSSSIHEVIPR
ncbi:MAG: hypothetical protein WC461_00900 [Candidatus Paceibacterota bacterium]